ncbi:unnamed protein product [Urochloa decumbens]|uniref:Wall-associated receptor kinase galacturonan-binding domain-containing protein n=2 Tax=Urochloa decumbens TaxID=240449 RepID=A0ABC8Z3R7_9POAL
MNSGVNYQTRFTPERAMAPLLLLLPALVLVAVADALPSSCSNVTCGGQVVQYPFSLLNKSDCGYPGLGLVCEDNATLILPVQAHRYRVVSIDYQAHTVAVSDADVDEYAIGCPRLHMNLTIDTTSYWLQLTPSDSNVTFLYNCDKNVSLSTAVELSWCQGDGGKRWYVLPDGGTGAEAYEYECEEVVVAPVLTVHKEGIVGGPGAPASPNGSIGEVVRAGFQLMYNAHSRQCDGCERSGGWCGYRHNQTGAGGMKFSCFCDNGPKADHCVSGYGMFARRDT